jgi:hypothetical protein
MRDPKEISEEITIAKKEIKTLELELKKSEDFYKWEFLTGSDEPGESIGFFNIAKAKLILSQLNKGVRLQFRHEALGTYEVYMSQQGNRILLDSESESVNEESIMGFIVWHSGDWYKIKKK